jgi:DNA-binding MarR family transcriptional regulator
MPAEVAGIRGSAGRTLGILPATGARPSDLAEGTSITKQSMTERLRDMERRGLIIIEPDPDDQRARIVRRTARGDSARDTIEGVIAGMEHDFASIVGPRRYQTFLDVLAQLGDSVEIKRTPGTTRERRDPESGSVARRPGRGPA